MPEHTNMHLIENPPETGHAANGNTTANAATPLRPPLPFQDRPSPDQTQIFFDSFYLNPRSDLWQTR
jgi:hypothetical protein